LLLVLFDVRSVAWAFLFSCSDMQKCQVSDLHISPPLRVAVGDGVERERPRQNQTHMKNDSQWDVDSCYVLMFD